jgi:hypothetical protein
MSVTNIHGCQHPHLHTPTQNTNTLLHRDTHTPVDRYCILCMYVGNSCLGLCSSQLIWRQLREMWVENNADKKVCIIIILVYSFMNINCVTLVLDNLSWIVYRSWRVGFTAVTMLLDFAAWSARFHVSSLANAETFLVHHVILLQGTSQEHGCSEELLVHVNNQNRTRKVKPCGFVHVCIITYTLKTYDV